MLSTSQRAEIISILRLFECNQREANIYVKALEMGPSTVQELASALRQNRITVHSAVRQLIEKGFVFESRRGKRRLLVAEEPVVLHTLVQRRETDLHVIKNNIGELVRLLSSVRRSESTVPAIRFYEGRDGFKRMLEETLEARGEIFVITYVDLFASAISPAYLEEYFRRRTKLNIHTKLIYPPSKFGERVKSRAKEYKIEMRTLPSEFRWRAGVFSWNDCVGIQSLTENRLTCTIIENRDIAQFWRDVAFPIIWRSAGPLH